MGTDKMAVYSLLGTVGGIVGLPVYAYAIAAQTYALQKKSIRKIKDEAKEYLKTGAGMAFLVIRDSMYLLLDREGANAKMYYFRYEYNTASEKII